MIKSRVEVTGESNNFCKRIKWSPDGRFLLGSTEKGEFEIFEYDTAEFKLNHKRTILKPASGANDFDWFPWMSQDAPGSECFLSCSRDVPVQLRDALDGTVRGTWIPKDHSDQIATCTSVACLPDGRNFLAGGHGTIFQFDFNRPGSEFVSHVDCYSKQKEGLKGIISNISCRFDNTGVFSAGSFNGSIGIFDARNLKGYETVSTIFKAHPNGVSQTKFLSDGWTIVSAGRNDSNMKIWDLRRIAVKDFSSISIVELPGYVASSQRCYFDVDRFDRIFSGSNSNLVEFVKSDLNSMHFVVKNTTELGNISNSVSCNPKVDNIQSVSCGTRRQFDDLEGSLCINKVLICSTLE